MAPIDDELRAAMHARADVLTPAPDPLAGIELRARGLRRRRLTASVTGAVLAVAAVAIGVGVLADHDPRSGEPPVFATQGPTNAVTSVDSPPPYTGKPVNLLAWQPRGTTTGTATVRGALTDATGRTSTRGSHYVPLYGGTRNGMTFTLGQAWYDGDRQAHTVGYTTGGSNGPVFFYGPVTKPDPSALALLVDSIPGSTTDLLVVVPRPGVGPVSYAADKAASLTAIASGRSDLNGIGFVDRAPNAMQDRLQVLDGDGMRQLYLGAVQPLLCGAKECG